MESAYTNESFKAYKSLETYNQFLCGWVSDVATLKINGLSLVFGKKTVEVLLLKMNIPIDDYVLAATQTLEDQLDAEIEKLDRMEDEDLQALERKRAAALKKQIKKKEELVSSGHGVYSELFNESEFFEASKNSKSLVVHFFRPSTMRCSIVDKHLQALAPKHVETRFCKINAEKSPFLVTRLKVRVLPTIVLCKEGKIVDYIIGFDDLGGVDDFSTEMMEWRIARANVMNYDGDIYSPPGCPKIKRINPLLKRATKTIRGGAKDSDTDSD
ncbi:hypothetical protein JTE90_003580 [Oedothorax gibbosus]|uniref:Thioredoxin domain-containing protein 9 n=1 Tax=Oedothorax gibbosus TaxID=931172 RepID=A0AAV6VJ28_9ARAC|nr:hypothetical protein JTE90_003580 [Oedothorax gibbosus]